MRETPKRLVKAFEQVFSGYRDCPDDVLDRTFGEIGNFDDLVVVRDIPFYSYCEHHMFPMVGRAHVAYFPVERVVGLSKIARVVDMYARRLQTQEHLTSQILSAIDENLKPRGVAIMMCILPSTRLAMDGWKPADAADASGLFNLMRNLGGAIGIALVDTIIQSRTASHVTALVTRLQAGDAGAARLVGLPTQMFRGQAMGPVDAMTKAIITPMVQRAALTQSLNESWLVLAGLFALSLFMVPMIRANVKIRL